MRYNKSATDRSKNFEDRLRETMDSELEPELVTPNSAASEEMPFLEEKCPLVKQFNQSNFSGRRKTVREDDDTQTGNR